ncbi:MAG: alpha/beta fold hydrolase [Winogradskyella sp.]|nr:alpha/beta fold hydrolase [Winogradskyella sp.]
MSFIHQKKVKRKLKTVLIIFLSLYVMLGSALYFFQERLLFLPTKLEQDYQYQFTYNFEELFFETESNSSINALHFKTENPKGIILYFHGNAGDLSRWGKITEYFVAKQYDVLVMDYRGYGKSRGKLSEDAFYNDAQYCYDYLLKHYKENEITLYGRSLGTGIASYLALENQPKQLILETPYYSIADVASRRFPVFPVESLLKYKFPTYKYLPNVKCPITIIHGTEDTVVPFASGRKLVGTNRKLIQFATIVGGNHNNLINFKKYHQAIESCLKTKKTSS